MVFHPPWYQSEQIRRPAWFHNIQVLHNRSLHFHHIKVNVQFSKLIIWFWVTKVEVERWLKYHQTTSIYHMVYKMSENHEKCPLQFPKAQGDVTRLLVLSGHLCKSQDIQSILTWDSKIMSPQDWEALAKLGTLAWKNDINDKQLPIIFS